MIRLILLGVLILLVARAFWRVIDGVLEAAGGAPRKRADMPGVKLMRDPVCGTYVAPDSALTLSTRGTLHYFCSEQCRSTFRDGRRR